MSDADRFEAFVRTYQNLVFATALRLLANATEAEDVSQIVFLKAFQHFDALKDSPAAAGWLRATARNTCLNYLSRYRARWRFFSELSGPGEGDVDEEALLSAIAERAVESGLEQADTQERLERALQRLPDHQRVPLVLYHFDEMSYRDIADLLGVSVGKVKTDIHRGRTALRRALSGHASR